MSGRYLLDTNIIIALFANDQGVRSALQSAAEVFVPAPAAGELFYGAAKSTRPVENTARIQQLLDQSVLLPCDAATAQMYGRLKNTLRELGKPLPENDVWIAAAQQHQLVLVSRDAHFHNIPDLTCQAW